MKTGYKKCPYCGEEIKGKAVKCRYCGEWLEGKTATTKTKNNKSSILGIIIPIVCIIFVILGICLAIKFSNNSGKQINNDSKQLETNFDRNMECQKYISLCEDKRQYIIDANYYKENGEKTVGIFYSPIEDDCLCYYNVSVLNYRISGENRFHADYVITDAFKEWSDPTRKTATYSYPGETYDCEYYSAYQGMTRDKKEKCPYANVKSSMLEEVTRLKGQLNNN